MSDQPRNSGRGRMIRGQRQYDSDEEGEHDDSVNQELDPAVRAANERLDKTF